MIKQDETKKNKISTKTKIFLVIMLFIYGVVFLYTYQNMQKSLYTERASNTTIVMGQINKSVAQGVDNRWKNAQHFARIFTRVELDTMEEAQEILESMRLDRGQEVSRLFLIDDQGNCYLSGEGMFKWSNQEQLTSGVQEFYVSMSEFQVTGDTEPHMYFLIPFEEPLTIEDSTITHLGLARAMSCLDPYFAVEDYGEEMMAFLVQRDGKQVYHQGKEHILVNEENIVTALERAEYFYGATYQQFKNDIETGTSGCICIEYEGIPYYLAYEPLEGKNWSSVLFIPSDNISSGTKDFMRSIIINTIIVILGAIAIVVYIVADNLSRMSKQRKEITEQLRRAAEAERSANDAKTQFLSSMSHDIRTPMNAIIGMTTLALKHLDDKNYVKNCLDKVNLASNHLLTLINDVLDISKVESGKMKLNSIVFSIADSMINIVNIVRPQIEAKKQQFEIRIHNVKQEYLYADELRINQIFINLLTNAVKYTPEGGKITVDLKQQPLDENRKMTQLVFVVEDNGIGMSEEFQKDMYNSFIRANENKEGKVQGTGLGLAICKQMTTLMDGEIQCQSAKGVGTRFTVTLKLPVADRAMEELVLPPMEILLVDDDEIFLETAKATLEDMGMTIESVSSGKEALGALLDMQEQESDYPVVILDWKLPGMDGIETTRMIRQSLGNDVPIIVSSASDISEVEKQALEAGANGFISKPFFPSTVYNKMNEILGLSLERKEEEDKEGSEVAGMHLLVAEDNDLNWEIVREMLHMYGITADRVENGEECVERIHHVPEGTYDLILMDIQMPVMNGYEAARHIRSSENEYVRQIPIIAMTADAFADDIQRCQEVGMNSHIAKPLNIKTMIRVIGNRGGYDSIIES